MPTPKSSARLTVRHATFIAPITMAGDRTGLARHLTTAAFMVRVLADGVGTYQHVRGYQPVLALWAEMNVVLADSLGTATCRRCSSRCRWYNVSFAVLPPSVRTYYRAAIRLTSTRNCCAGCAMSNGSRVRGDPYPSPSACA